MAEAIVGRRIYRTSVILKTIMGVSGAIVFGWLILHMTGNLKVFAGQAEFDAYALWLRQTPFLLLGSRVLTGIAIVAHIASAVALWKMNKAARPVAYQHPRKNLRTTYAARTMMWSGPIVGLYIIYHLAHLTFGMTIDDYQPGKVYHAIVTSFQNPLVSIIYIVANVLVGIHLYHGAWSFFQSLGLNHPRYNHLRRAFATTLSVGLTVGFITVPIAVLLGFVK